MEWTRGRTIGRGSTATVSIATADQSGDVFAVKSCELSQSESLRREQRILSTLSCPRVLACKGCDISSENGMLVYNLLLEYAPGGTITDAIQKQGGRLDEAMVRSYTRGILQGLEFLHSSGIVHCDIKGRNVLVTDDGVKIADLGCARRADVVPGAAWSVAGTPVYMAPEVARGEQQGFPADVWALGCTVIEMATGRAPWPDVGDPVSALYRIGFSRDMPEIPSDLSKQAKDFLSKCLRRDPVERWTATQLLAHDFVKEMKAPPIKGTDGSELSTPTTVLNLQLWDSMEELETIHIPSRKNRLSKIIMERIQQLGETNLVSSSEMPVWEWDENWVTVRSNGSGLDLETLSNRQDEDDKLLHADEPASSCGGDMTRVSKDYDLLVHHYPTKISRKNTSRNEISCHRTYCNKYSAYILCRKLNSLNKTSSVFCNFNCWRLFIYKMNFCADKYSLEWCILYFETDLDGSKLHNQCHCIGFVVLCLT
ncbi:hypothetical protein POUND7_002469 [Theobroma cacao]